MRDVRNTTHQTVPCAESPSAAPFLPQTALYTILEPVIADWTDRGAVCRGVWADG